MTGQGSRTRIWIFPFLVLLLCIFFIADMLFGSVDIAYTDIIKVIFSKSYAASHPVWNMIVFDFRMPKAIVAVIAGAALSISGLQMQTIFRNPLAGPDVLGISSGASLGVAIMVIGISFFKPLELLNFSGNWSIVFAAFLGSLGTLFIILVVSFRIRDILTILVLGIIIGSAMSAIVSILQYFSSAALLKSFVVWTLGSLGHITRQQIWILVPCFIIGLLLSVFSVKNLDALQLGENYAKTLGINIRWARIIVFTATSIFAGSITAFCGPIGFIGIAVPHLCRIMLGTARQMVLLWACVLLGGIIMLASDIISQLPGSNYTLPINSITSLLGIPVVIWIILTRKKVAQ